MVPTAAEAIIHPATVIDGPSNEVLDVDGSALAPDGSGAIVYRKQSGGVIHVYAAQFINGWWGAAMQVDTADGFGASQPAIAAGVGGRLLVVWIEPRNVSPKGILQYQLVGSSLQPGASAFGPAVVIDANVGEPNTGDVSAVAPTLAMAPNGAAYVVYRVITDDCPPEDDSNPEEAKCHPGSTDKVVQVRVARFDYLRWSTLGAINRASQVALRDPTPLNAPSIGIDGSGNGIVAWQEPGNDGVARIWVRRLFGAVLGNVLEASPEKIGEQPVTSDADAPIVAVSPYGEGRIAFRIQGAPGSAVSSPRLYVNSISSSLGLKASVLNGAVPVTGPGTLNLGAPSAAIDRRGDFRLSWSAEGTAQDLTGTDEALGSSTPVGSTTGQAYTTINPAGGGTTAWSTTTAGAPVVDVREDYARGAYQLAQLAGDVAGPVGGLSLGGSGEGDALLGWTQGSIGEAEVVGAFVQAPPAPFNVSGPSGWIRGGQASIAWEPSPDAVAGVTYTVYVDGKPRIKELHGLVARMTALELGDGTHRMQVLATDAAGQQTMSSAHALKIDVNPPSVTYQVIEHHRGVRLQVRDTGSGISTAALKFSFGDGQRSTKRATVTHVYARAGTYSVVVQVADKVGNRATVHLRVRVQ
jgi:hypothetical protein